MTELMLKAHEYDALVEFARTHGFADFLDLNQSLTEIGVPNSVVVNLYCAVAEMRLDDARLLYAAMVEWFERDET
jgi:hypothetical protein